MAVQKAGAGPLKGLAAFLEPFSEVVLRTESNPPSSGLQAPQLPCGERPAWRHAFA